LPLIHIGEELVKRGHLVYLVSTNYGRETRLKAMADEIGIKTIFTNDQLLRENVIPGNYEDVPFLTWKKNLKEVFIEN
jgi:hypothetical protein